MVEAAFVLLLFLSLVFAIVEGSLYLRDSLTAAHVAGQAGRAASTYGNNADADFQIVREVREAAAVIGTDRIVRVVVWHATGDGDTVPAGCRNGSSSTVSGRECNVYSGSAFTDDDPANFDCTPSAPHSSGAWCPTTRKVALTGTGGPPDYLGIFVRIEYRPATDFLGGSRVIDRQAIYRLEPQVLS
jgi:Flp pilus assembly protein TadG